MIIPSSGKPTPAGIGLPEYRTTIPHSLYGYSAPPIRWRNTPAGTVTGQLPAPSPSIIPVAFALLALAGVVYLHHKNIGR